MRNRNRFVIIAIIIVSCAVMAAVETIIEPPYIVKSSIKFIAFIRLSSYVPRKAAFLFSSVMFSIYHVAFIGRLSLGKCLFWLWSDLPRED